MLNVWLPKLVGIAILVGFPILVYVLFRIICRPNLGKTFSKVYDGITVQPQPFPGSVNLKFDTYHGFLFYAIHTKHDVWANPNDAMLLLRRLHWFNVTRGFFAHGAVFIPILSWFNYRSETKRLQEQMFQS